MYLWFGQLTAVALCIEQQYANSQGQSTENGGENRRNLWECRVVFTEEESETQRSKWFAQLYGESVHVSLTLDLSVVTDQFWSQCRIN